MAEVIITESLKKEIYKKFKEESKKIFKLIYSLKENPKKGKELGQVQGLLIKELKYKNFRFYFLMQGYLLKILGIDDLKELVIKFVRMSNKKDQQKTIDEIKDILRNLGEQGF